MQKERPDKGSKTQTEGKVDFLSIKGVRNAIGMTAVAGIIFGLLYFVVAFIGKDAEASESDVPTVTEQVVEEEIVVVETVIEPTITAPVEQEEIDENGMGNRLSQAWSYILHDDSTLILSAAEADFQARMETFEVDLQARNEALDAWRGNLDEREQALTTEVNDLIRGEAALQKGVLNYGDQLQAFQACVTAAMETKDEGASSPTSLPL